MALLRWLAGHLVLVFIVVVLVFVYVFRAEISTELGLKDVVDQETLARYWPTRQAAEPAPAPQVAATEEPAPKAAPEPAVTPAPQPAAPEAAAPLGEPAPLASAPEAAAPQASAPQASAPQAPAAPAAAPSGGLDEAWVAARTTFRDGDRKAAIAQYEALVKAYPDEADLAGELGNLYLLEGREADAAAQYHEAGRRLLRTDNPARANGVLGILNQLDPNLADDLRKKLFDAMNGAPSTQ